MGKLFDNLYLVLAIGLGVAILLMAFPDSAYAPPNGILHGVLQWLHVFCGITWIGLL
jgi:hypothetical protein